MHDNSRKREISSLSSESLWRHALPAPVQKDFDSESALVGTAFVRQKETKPFYSAFLALCLRCIPPEGGFVTPIFAPLDDVPRPALPDLRPATSLPWPFWLSGVLDGTNRCVQCRDEAASCPALSRATCFLSSPRRLHRAVHAVGRAAAEKRHPSAKDSSHDR